MFRGTMLVFALTHSPLEAKILPLTALELFRHLNSKTDLREHLTLS